MTDDIDIKTLESADIATLKEAEKSSVIVANDSQRKSEIEEAGGEKDGEGKGSWIGGVVLIAIGTIFLITNFTDFELDNWWALFILIPAFSTLGNAVRVYKRDEHLGQEGRGSLIGGMVMLFVAAAFLFSWNWGLIWPYFLIFGGLGLLLNAVLD